jgi:hypothetical protein
MAPRRRHAQDRIGPSSPQSGGSLHFEAMEESGESSRRGDQLDGFSGQARDAEKRWAEIPSKVGQAARRGEEADLAAERAWARQAQVVIEAQSERARRAAGEDIGELSGTLQELATQVEEARKIEETARAERDRRVEEARAAEDTLLAAERRSAKAVERANRLKRLATDAAQRQQEAHAEERVAAAKLARNLTEARRAEARRLNAQARRLKLTSEREDTLRRIEASRHIERTPDDRGVPTPDRSGPSKGWKRRAGVSKRWEVGGETPDLTVLLADVPKQHPAQVAERRQAPSRPFIGTETQFKPWLVSVVIVLFAGLSMWLPALTSAPSEDAQRPSPRPAVEESGPVEDRPPQTRPVIPDLAGLSISAARDRLLEADLTLDRIVPAPGPPGVVVGADPPTGGALPAGSAVRLYVGVEPDRLELELEGP